MYDSIRDMDEYVEARFELNEKLKTMTKEQIIMYVNFLINECDEEEYPIVASEEQLKELYEEEENNE